MKFNEKLKELRINSIYTQQDCANHLGVSVVTWRQYEQGVRSPKPEALMQIAILFDVTLDDLLCIEDFKKSLSISSDRP